MIVRIIFLLLLSLSVSAQNTIGLPAIFNYSNTAYSGGLQNWDIQQDKNGIIYIANNEGLLTYDGHTWNIYPLPNRTIVRSVAIGANGNIYVGGQDEFGYFSANTSGKIFYTSLVSSIAEKDKKFGDVWDIACFNNEVFFRGADKIYRFNAKTVSIYAPQIAWSYLSSCNGKLYAYDFKNGLCSFENDTWVPVKPASLLLNNKPVNCMLAINRDSIVIGTDKDGFYLLSANTLVKIISQDIEKIKAERIYTAVAISNKLFAVGTNDGGVYIINIQGKIVQRFSKADGLQTNNVLNIFLDKRKNLWLGLNNGIDLINYNTAVKRISTKVEDGSGYVCIIYHNTFYTGTSSGLFYVPLSGEQDISFTNGIFKPVTNTRGQIWTLANINDQLLLGCNNGQFIVKDYTAAQIVSPTTAGFWNFTALSSLYPAQKIIAGNYKGLSFLEYSNNNFKVTGSVNDFSESSRFVAIDNAQDIWVSHPYHGIFKIVLQADGKYKTILYRKNDGLPSDFNNYVFKIKNEVLITTENGVYAYNNNTYKFEISKKFQEILGNQSIRYLKEDTHGNIWFIHEKKLGVIDMSAKKPTIIFIPELDNKMISGFESMYALDNNNLFVGGEKGFFHINYEQYKLNLEKPIVMLRTVKLTDKKDSLLFGGYTGNGDEIQTQAISQVAGITNGKQTIRFEYIHVAFGEQINTTYSYRLKGFDAQWSEWTGKTEKEYTNLFAGKYTFEVKCRSANLEESDTVRYTFNVEASWYQTGPAYFLYFLLFCAGVYFLQKFQRKKFFAQQLKYEEEQKKIQYLHQLELDKTELQIVALRNEKLQAEIDFKNSELATSAMHLVQKGELITKIKAEINGVMKEMDNEKGTQELKKMVKVLSEDDKVDKDWEQFARHFDKVHSDFVGGVKEKFPSVSGNELKLCAYLRMNLSTKEIAQLMNISTRGVEISRYRLRKKLGIPTEMSLFDYLIRFSK